MRYFFVFFIFILGAHGLDANPRNNPSVLNPKNVWGLIEGFSPTQIALWNDYISAQHANKLKLSQITTFASITHALEHTILNGGQNALSMVDRVLEVDGEIPAAASYKQFNLAVIWRPQAIKAFEESGFTYRMGFGHNGESGVSYHSSSYGIHVLYKRSNLTQGHVHVDYRYFSLTAYGEGHFHPYNADVRALGPELDGAGQPIDNYLRHVQWYGAIPDYRR